MDIKRIYICAALFIFLTSVKYFAPEHSELIRAKVSEIIEGDDDYSAMVSAMGKKLYTGELKDELVQAFNLFEPENKAVSGLPDNVLPEKYELPFDYCCPVGGTKSSAFGYREHPIEGVEKFHYGMDIAAESGAEILAFADGVVSAVGTNDSYGNYVIISHDGGYSSLYAHLLDFAVREGTEVKRAELIGYVGQSGAATAAHLHFELTCNGQYIDPGYYI